MTLPDDGQLDLGDIQSRIQAPESLRTLTRLQKLKDVLKTPSGDEYKLHLVVTTSDSEYF